MFLLVTLYSLQKACKFCERKISAYLSIIKLLLKFFLLQAGWPHISNRPTGG